MSKSRFASLRPFIFGLVLLAVIVALLVPVFSARGSRAHAQSGSFSNIHTVFFVMFENTSITDIIGNPAAPYLNNTLLPESSYATNASDVAGEHPSLTAYLMLEAGSTLGVTTDNPPLQQSFSTTAHFTTQLKNAGLSWKVYAEGMSGTNCPLKSTSTYGVWHNASVYFHDTTGNNSLSNSYCITHERPYSQLATDLSAGKAANYTYIQPSLGHSMHQAGGCSTSTNPITCGDQFLSTLIPKITASSQYKSGGALFITWDEGSDHPDGSDGDGPLGIIVLSPFEKGPGYVDSTTLYHHADILRTWEEIFGLPYLGDAASANDLANLFQ